MKKLLILAPAVLAVVACTGSEEAMGPGDSAPQPALTTLIVEASDSTLVVEQTATLSAKGLDQNGKPISLPSQPTYSVSPAVVATISGNQLTGANPGHAAVTATVGSVSGTLDLTVTGPNPTEWGTPTGPAVTQSIGPEGGSLTSADGVLTVTIPGGAVATATEFTIEPITNQAHGGIGGAYRLTRPPNISAPFKLTFTYSDAELGNASPEGLGIAFQDDLGNWWGLLSSAVEQTSRAPREANGREELEISLLIGCGPLGTAREEHIYQESIVPPDRELEKAGIRMPVASTTDYGPKLEIHLTRVRFWRFEPCAATLKTKEQLSLLVTACVQELWDLVGAYSARQWYLMTACYPSVRTGKWAANGVLGGNATFGTVVAGQPTSLATYTAPAKVPSPNPVTVTATMTWGEKNLSKTFTSIITVEGCSLSGSPELWQGPRADDPSGDVCPINWTGTSSYTDTQGGVSAVAQVTWELDVEASDSYTLVYHPEGTVTLELRLSSCESVSPLTHAVTKDDGELQVDLTTDPPTYSGFGVTHWEATYTHHCDPPGSSPTHVGAPWFSGWGSVSPDGVTITGTLSGDAASWTYNFTRK
jgi:hypothetical protein